MPVSGELLQEKALRSVLYVPRRGTRDAPGEFQLQACSSLADPAAVGLRKGTWGVGLPSRLLRSAEVKFEWLAPALPVYSELPASGAHLRAVVEWLCVVFLLGEVSEVYFARRARLWRVQLRFVGMASPRPRARSGLAFATQLG